MNKNDDEAFLKSIIGTSPIKKKNKIQKSIPLKKYIEKKTNIKKNIPEVLKKNKILLNLDTVFYKKEKIKINKKLKKKEIFIDKKIDFHGYSLLDAEETFIQTIKECYKKKLRCILFVTGKGVLKKNEYQQNNTRLYYGIIRNNFLSWTEKAEMQKYILGVELASIEYGGDGAFFVYLRKNKF